MGSHWVAAIACKGSVMIVHFIIGLRAAVPVAFPLKYRAFAGYMG